MQNKPGVPSSFGNVVKLEFLITVKLKGFLHCLARMLTNFHESFAKSLLGQHEDSKMTSLRFFLLIANNK